MTEERVLSLPMRKVHALEILRGEKVREYRACTDHWAKILGECNDPEDPHTVTGLKKFDRVHFFTFSKQWFLDCKFKAMILTEIDDEFIRLFGKEYAGQKGEWVFVIRLDGVIDTNLTEEV